MGLAPGTRLGAYEVTALLARMYGFKEGNGTQARCWSSWAG